MFTHQLQVDCYFVSDANLILRFIFMTGIVECLKSVYRYIKMLGNLNASSKCENDFYFYDNKNDNKKKTFKMHL